jgi:hypothetical protein
MLTLLREIYEVLDEIKLQLDVILQQQEIPKDEDGYLSSQQETKDDEDDSDSSNISEELSQDDD